MPNSFLKAEDKIEITIKFLKQSYGLYLPDNRIIMRYFFLFLFAITIFNSCRKEEKITSDPSAKLEFSGDTVLFDTVFTTVGSTVASFLVYNPNDKKVVISSIQLAGGETSQFRLNIDGVPGASASNVEISGHDSLFIFVEVNIDPTNALSPFLVKDSILFSTNGNVQDIKLLAYGQDAHYFHPNTHIPGYPPFSIIPCVNNIAHWVNDKPYEFLIMPLWIVAVP